MKPLYRKTLLRFLPIVFNLERANQLSLLPDKDLADFCPLLEPYQVTKNHKIFGHKKAPLTIDSRSNQSHRSLLATSQV
ncbi:MAG: hypothetical protein EWV48_07595 [Microcystis aeruginosa Ma_QC_C_20070823_S13]|nr:MAG: hypothetical protein EWV48_07595 [Microcystis aeruginosa Ma_QC_C_20070823_S13]